MTLRALFLADGVSDLPLARHIETICAQTGFEVLVTEVAAERLGNRTVAGRIRIVLAEDPDFDLIFVHRDSEDSDPEPRRLEVENARNAVGFAGPVVAVIAIRMTEAWLLLDESEIRMVAGRPNGQRDLGLPTVKEAERVADPKQLLREALVRASDLSGRKLKIFRTQFPTHRRLLLDRLDLQGDVQRMVAWQRMRRDIADALISLGR